MRRTRFFVPVYVPQIRTLFGCFFSMYPRDSLLKPEKDKTVLLSSRNRYCTVHEERQCDSWIIYIQGGQMKSGQILSHIYSKTVLNIIFKFYTLVTEYISCLRSQSQHNGYRFRTSGRGYVDGG